MAGCAGGVWIWVDGSFHPSFAGNAAPFRTESRADGGDVALRGSRGHQTIRRGHLTSQLPMHGSRRQLGARLIAKIKKDLELS